MTRLPPTETVAVETAAATTAAGRAAAPKRPPHPDAPTGGLYRADREHDACGVGFVADLSNTKSHKIIEDGFAILNNLEHRGAVGADPLVGDGAGLLVQIPHRFFTAEAKRHRWKLPEPGHYAVGHVFLPQDATIRAEMEQLVEEVIAEEGQTLIGWRDVPVDNASLSAAVAHLEPIHRQVVIGRGINIDDEDSFERRLYIIRKVISARVYAAYSGLKNDFYIVSLSCRTLVYKGMFLSYQLGAYYEDLNDPIFESAMALVHQRFSTNTFPSWRLAHPYRFVAHNGEINTVRGNVNWMAARQASVSSPLFGNDISKLWPISYEGQSDTACFDNALEFLIRGGYSLPHAAMTLIPEAWAGNPLMDEDRRAFYEYHAALMEPWDGPAAMAFSDGRMIGGTLDRNGLRPARYFVTDDGMVVMASEAGVLAVEQNHVVTKWRLQPGKMLLIDLEQHRIISDDEIKRDLAKAHPYRAWLARTQIVLEDLPPVPARAPRADISLLDRQQAFGYTQEDLKLLMAPMAVTGQEAVGSMGNDAPIAAMSDRSKLLYTYFKQNFAQVTNPPIDSIREELVMSLVSFIGPRPNLFDREGLSRRKRLEVRQPILTNDDLEKIRSIGDLDDNPFEVEDARHHVRCRQRRQRHGARARSSLRARGGSRPRRHQHHHLVGSRRRTRPRADTGAAGDRRRASSSDPRRPAHVGGLVVETGDAREVHHFCCLAGYGAEAINPYLAFETLIGMNADLDEKISAKEVVKRYIKAIDKGILKVMSKMGISTYQSYCGAQIFDAVGLSTSFVGKYFTGTATTIEGAGLPEICSGDRPPASRRVRRRAGPCGLARSRRRLCSSVCAARITSGPRRRCATCNTRCAPIRQTRIARSRRR